ncbi:MAG: AgmX/PglI C-terminal domain-containing protein [Kofleriaceae bacterium]
MKKALILSMLSLAVVACGGKKGGSSTTPEPVGETKPETDGAATMVSPDTADEIQRMFARKSGAVSRCLSIAIDNKELPKNSRGKVTLEVTITPAGKPGEVKVIKATLESKTVTDCVIERVKEIQFPEVPIPYPTTYTYAFEAS